MHAQARSGRAKRATLLVILYSYEFHVLPAIDYDISIITLQCVEQLLCMYITII